MTADEQPEEQKGPSEPAGASTPAERRANRPVPMKARSDTDKAMALELARLVGVSPRLLVNPDPAAPATVDPPPAPADAEATGDEENGDAAEGTTS